MPIIKPGEVFDGHTGQTNNVRGRMYSPALPTTYTITSEAFSAIAGGTAIVDWTAPVGHSASDTVLVSPVGGTSFTPTLINETALNGRTNVILPTPTELYELPDKDATQFEFEYWADGAESPTAVSPSFTLRYPTGIPYTITISVSEITFNGAVSFDWTQPWNMFLVIGLFEENATIDHGIPWALTYPTVGYGVGNDIIALPDGENALAPGTRCNVRLYSASRHNLELARSTTFTVVASAPD